MVEFWLPFCYKWCNMHMRCLHVTNFSIPLNKILIKIPDLVTHNSTPKKNKKLFSSTTHKKKNTPTIINEQIHKFQTRKKFHVKHLYLKKYFINPTRSQIKLENFNYLKIFLWLAICHNNSSLTFSVRWSGVISNLISCN